MIIRADLHVHSYFSFDGVLSLDDIIKQAKKKQIDAVAICDHDCCEIISQIKEKCDSDGLIDGVLVIAGAEFTTDAGHILGLFLTKSIDNSKDENKIIERIYTQSGVAVMAHPFERKMQNSRRDILIKNGAVAVECFNARSESVVAGSNQTAANNAIEYNCVFTAGSDAHRKSEIGNGYIMLDVESLTYNNVLRAIYERKGTVCGISPRRTPRGMSQITRAIRLRQWKRMPKRLAVLCWFFITDLFSVSQKDITTIIGGESYGDNN